MLLIILVLIISIFFHSALSVQYASQALSLWFEHMIPSLFPFMVLSGIIVRKGYSTTFSKPFFPIVGKLYHINPTMCTTMLLGLLFGFPLGAKTIAEQYQYGYLSKKQAEYLLAFCNNIGPIYLLSFAFPLLQIAGPLLLIHIAIPLLYGLFLRYTLYRSLPVAAPSDNPQHFADTISAIDDSITSACMATMKLGGYMVFFILWNLPAAFLPHLNILKYTPALLEITSGLIQNQPAPYPAMVLITFSGLSCYAQTYTCIKHTDLCFTPYCIHKLIQTSISAIIYGVFFFSF
ncbi:MAG: hypothetical protein E7299_09180 [Lachnospiraceae bacterium]|nr:hypothetical protein [Lachnospiraceae bacterium]